MKLQFLKSTVLILGGIIIIGGISGCDNANANGATFNDAVAAFRITRGILPQNSSIQQADVQCNSEFGSAYTTASKEEINGLTNINTLQVFLYSFDRGQGKYSEGCVDAYCVVVCIHK